MNLTPGYCGKLCYMTIASAHSLTVLQETQIVILQSLFPVAPRQWLVHFRQYNRSSYLLTPSFLNISFRLSWADITSVFLDTVYVTYVRFTHFSCAYFCIVLLCTMCSCDTGWHWSRAVHLHMAHPDFAKYSRVTATSCNFQSTPSLPEVWVMAGKTILLWYLLCVEGFRVQRLHIQELMYCNGFVCIFRTHNIFNFLVNFCF